MISYEISEEVEAFTAGRADTLPCEVCQPHQTHGYESARIDRPGVRREELEGIDALMTNVRGVAIGVRTADCFPILLYDVRNRAAAAVHSGWKGTVQRISQKVLFRMRMEYGTAAEDVQAVIGPGICFNCFQVGDELVDFFRNAGFPLNQMYCWKGAAVEGDARTGHHLDLCAANKFLLIQAGVPETNIQLPCTCTYEDKSLFSARREGVGCGRNINFIRIL